MRQKTYFRIFLVLSIFFITTLKAQTANWIEKIPNDSLSPPPSREDASMAFDPNSGLTILFGGFDGNDTFDFLGDTQIYNSSSNTWTQVIPVTGSPSARSGASMVFDPAANQIIMFGGSSNDGFLNDTWAYNVNTNTWVNLILNGTAGSPSARERASMAFDLNSNQMILFGGDVGGTTGLDDTWGYRFDTNTWTSLNPNANLARTQAMMAYDPILERVVLFGGRNGSTVFNDTWSFAAGTHLWFSAPNSTPAPVARYAGNLVLDSHANVLVLFGGTNDGFEFNDTWIYNSNLGWQNLIPNGTMSSPVQRDMASMSFDSIKNQTILFGGFNSNSFSDLNDTWSLAIQIAPQFITDDTDTFTVGIFASLTIQTTGDPSSSINETGALPAGVSFVDNGNGTATLSGTPTAGTTGNYPITFTASNGVAPDAVQNFILIVDQVGQGPIFTSPNEVTFTIDTSSNFTITTTGDPSPTLSVSGILPSGIVFIDRGDGTATLSGTPAIGSQGTYPLVFTASNSISSVQQAFTLNINQPSVSITLTTSTLFASIGQPVTLTVNVVPSSTLGTVTFFDELEPLGTASLNQGIATLTTSFTRTGSHIIYAIYNDNSSITSPAMNILVERPLPPQNVQGLQKVIKKDLVNVITWQAPVGGVSITSYRIYRKSDLFNPISVISSNQPLVFTDSHRKPCKTYKYYVVSVDQFNNLSVPVLVKIKGKHRCH